MLFALGCTMQGSCLCWCPVENVLATTLRYAWSVEQSPQVNTTAEMTPPNPSCVAGPFLDTEFNIALVFLSQKPVRGHSGRFRADVNDIISCKDPCTAWHEVNNWPRS